MSETQQVVEQAPIEQQAPQMQEQQVQAPAPQETPQEQPQQVQQQEETKNRGKPCLDTMRRH